MRTALFALVGLAGCGGDDPPVYTTEGGSLEIADCGYTITTRAGAEPPHEARDVVGPDPTPRHVHLGIVGDPRTSMVVQWRTVDEITQLTRLRLGIGEDLPASELADTHDGIEFAYDSLGAEQYRIHQVHLCGLEPGTAYSYQVGSPGHYSPVYTFRTAPDVDAQPDTETLVAFVGDSRGGYDIWQQVVEQFIQRAPDLVVFSGDAVAVGIVQDEWEEFFTRGEPLLAEVPLVFAHGNHEVNAVNFYSQIAMPGDQENFGLDYGFAHLTVVNDTPADPGVITGSTREFLRSDFEASAAARWKLLTHHKPMWSASNHGSDLMLQAAWGPLVDEFEIDLVLNGHEHEVEMTHPLRGGVVQASNQDGTVYVVSGGAGAPLYDNGMDVWTAYSEKTYGAATIRVTRDQLAMELFRPDGSAIPASFTKTKP